MIRAILTGLAALAGAVSSAQAQPAAFGTYNPAPAFSESVTTSFYLPMRDGVRIAMQVSRPARNGVAVEGKFPVIWHATLDLPGAAPVERPDRGEGGNWARLVRQGYVIVDVARRGAGASFGVRRGYHDRQEAYDSYEITEWLAAQPWSNGKVGMRGCSNTGEAVMHALTVAPPSLKAAWAGCFSWSKYDGFLRGGGIVANWGSGPQRTLEDDLKARPVDADRDRTMLAEAARAHQNNVDLAALMRSLPFRDSYSPLTRSPFAVEGSIGSYAEQIRRSGVPLYIQGGWYDDFRKEGLVTLANVPNSRIIIGPWYHCANGDFDLIGEAQRFFDFHLKGIDTGIQRDDPIHYFTVGAPKGKEWRSAKSWRSVPENGETLYLSPGALAPRAGSAAREARFTVAYDDLCADKEANPTRAQPCHPRAGALSFSGPNLTRDTELTGFPVASLWVSSTTPDANLFVYLEDVAPDGTVTPLTDGRQKLSLRKRHEPPWAYLGLPWKRAYAEDAQPLKAGEPVEVVIDLLPISYVVRAGHRIQLTVAGADPRERARTVSAPAPVITVHTGKGRQSSLSLPTPKA